MTARPTGSLVELFSRLDLDPDDPAAPYRGLRELQSRLGDEQPLLADPPLLRSVLELSAVVDPRLFFAMLLHHCVATGAALDHGAGEEDLHALVSARWIGAALMNEQGFGNSSARIRTEAVYDPATREFVLTTPVPEAAKHPAAVALPGFARLGVVSARLLVGGADSGTALFLVELRDEDGPRAGVTITPHAGTAPVPMDFASIRFDGVVVPFERWLADGASIDAAGELDDPLGGPDARSLRGVSMGRFAWGGASAGLAAAARSGAAIALTRARHRRTLDRLGGEVTAIDHLSTQRMVFGAITAALAATVVARGVSDRCWRVAPGGGRGTGPSAADLREMSLGKVVVSVLADTAVSRARSACGASGLLGQHGLSGYQALTTTFQSAGGDNRLNLLNAAWSMAFGSDYRPPDDAAGDDWSLLARSRERVLYAELTSGLAPTFEGWNERTGLAQRFAEAHCARTTVESLRAHWHSTSLLEDLYEVHCLEMVHADAGWFLAHGLVSAPDVLALPSRLDAIHRNLVPHADDLLALLGIPADLLHGLVGTTGFLQGM
ncbi:hypothetical protein [Lentzea sp. NPDC059081]|uniref:hypothetical protein n=1 Tax=Lentzea sp. NPDC059081 TaxID=3346719 RepID=UPI003690E590